MNMGTAKSRGAMLLRSATVAGLCLSLWIAAAPAAALEEGDIVEIVTGVLRSEDANVVVFQVTDDNPRLLQALERYFAARGLNPNDPELPCAYCSTSTGLHRFKLPADDPAMITDVEAIVQRYGR